MANPSATGRADIGGVKCEPARQPEQDRQIPERDEAVIEVVEKLAGRTGVRWVATSMDQARAFLKDLYNEALMAGRHYEPT
jgi:hypothetical protein